MNFYKRHLGDIAKSLSNLSQGQIGAYDLLLDWHYANEQPLPLDPQELYQIGRARSKVERENVDRVLRYFDKGADGYTQKRALEEIESYNRRCETNREQGKLGGRPKGKRKETDSVTEPITESVSQKNPSQKPESRNQIKAVTSTPEFSTAAPSAAGVGTKAGHAAASLNRAGLRVTSQNPNLIAACDEGVTTDALLEVQRQYPDKPAGYVIAAARRIQAEQASPIGTTGESHANPVRLSAAERVLAHAIEGERADAERTNLAAHSRPYVVGSHG